MLTGKNKSNYLSKKQKFSGIGRTKELLETYGSLRIQEKLYLLLNQKIQKEQKKLLIHSP